MRKFSVKPNSILFVTTRGSYNCNCKAIANAIIQEKLPWTIYWAIHKNPYFDIYDFPNKINLITRETYDFYRIAASCKIWFDNSVNLYYMDAWKKPEQILFQTWHGSLGLKRFETSTDKKWIKKATQSGNDTAYCISNSTFESELFSSTFWKNAEILEYGHARNDILLCKNEEQVNALKGSVYYALKIPKNVRICLYGPTYRDNRKDMSPYAVDYEGVKNALEERFGGEWIIITRLHLEIKKALKSRKIEYPEFVIDATDYPDIQDLLVIADAGITDYSSWICDFVLTRRPGFFFTVDLRNYYTERGFYYPLESTPFPMAVNNSQLINNIRNFDNEKYIRDCDAFIAEKGCVDDGHAAERIVEKLKEVMNS